MAPKGINILVSRYRVPYRRLFKRYKYKPASIYYENKSYPPINYGNYRSL